MECGNACCVFRVLFALCFLIWSRRLGFCGVALLWCLWRHEWLKGEGAADTKWLRTGAALSAGGWMMLPHQPYIADVLSSLLWLLLVHDLVVMLCSVFVAKVSWMMGWTGAVMGARG